MGLMRNIVLRCDHHTVHREEFIAEHHVGGHSEHFLSDFRA
jgi:hypothetical protein